MIEITRRACAKCKRLEGLGSKPTRSFKIIEGKHNKKIICLTCGNKIFVKKDAYLKIYSRGAE